MPSWPTKSPKSCQLKCKEASENGTSLDDFGILILEFRGLCLVVLVAPTLMQIFANFERVVAVHKPRVCQLDCSVDEKEILCETTPLLGTTTRCVWY